MPRVDFIDKGMLHFVSMRNTHLMILGFVTILVSSPLVHAQPNANAPSTESPAVQTITFKDGTVLKGNLSAVADGYYIIDTVNLGQVRVPVEKAQSWTNVRVRTLRANCPRLRKSTEIEFNDELHLLHLQFHDRH